jgi:hypothetical protein
MKLWLYREPPPAWPTDMSSYVEYWFASRGAECVVFNYDDLYAGKLDADLRNEPENTVVYGGVGSVRTVLHHIGRPLPNLPDFPESIRQFAGRKVWDSTLAEIFRILNQEPERLPLHVKPHRQKLFTGVVVREFKDLLRTAGLPDDTPILMQEVVEFVSEWRAIILHHEILNVAHYKGDPLLFPDPAPIKAAVEAFSDQPVAYALDWGITSDGRTLLVETNDAHSLGNYGLRGYIYCDVITARWHELMGVTPYSWMRKT